jgi:hypothetical protein
MASIKNLVGSNVALLILINLARLSMGAASLKQNSHVQDVDDEQSSGHGSSALTGSSSSTGYSNVATKRKSAYYNSPAKSPKTEYFDLPSPAWKEYTPSPFTASKYISG